MVILMVGDVACWIILTFMIWVWVFGLFFIVLFDKSWVDATSSAFGLMSWICLGHPEPQTTWGMVETNSNFPYRWLLNNDPKQKTLMFHNCMDDGMYHYRNPNFWFWITIQNHPEIPGYIYINIYISYIHIYIYSTWFAWINQTISKLWYKKWKLWAIVLEIPLDSRRLSRFPKVPS
jgi:hypothetical protein